MTTNTYRNQTLEPFTSRLNLSRGLAFGVIIITALLAFEIFNYSTTDYALTDLLGDLKFMGLRWATILSIAFCGIDFAGIARLFAPEQGKTAHNETWYLFGAWLLAAAMNAMLTWWGVSLAILNHQALGNAVLERETLIRVVPIFVAILVWLIRVLIIGAFSVAGEQLFELADTAVERRPAARPALSQAGGRAPIRPAAPVRPSVQAPASAASRARVNPAPRAAAPASAERGLRAVPIPPGGDRGARSTPARETEPEYAQAELTYHPVSMRGGARPPEAEVEDYEGRAARSRPGTRAFN
ncbi:MAG: hypothetical protein JXA78_10200 [Anaerolineales bacterium]|nr:hypothetical protein [Anaerolineales bacterium]